jgi:hypothetical protein
MVTMTVRAILSLELDAGTKTASSSISIIPPASLSSSAQTHYDSGDGANKMALAA